MTFPFIRRSRPAIAAGALAVAAALALAGCSGGGSSSSSSSAADAAQGGTLTIAANYGPTSLDPTLQSVDPVNNEYIYPIYDYLTRLGDDGKVEPDLATSWKYTDKTNTTFQLTLRKDLKFSDGTPLTASDVTASLNYARAKGVNASWVSTISAITAPDDTTVQIRTSTPNDSLPSVLTQRLLLGGIISPAGLADPASIKSKSFGSGPYVLDTADTVAGDHYTYTPNKYYWDQSKIHWKRIVIKVAGSTTASLQAVQNGEADLMIGDATTGTAATSAGLGVATAAYGLTGIEIGDRAGTVVPALKSAEVRQALLYAIDRDAVAQAVYKGFATPGAGALLKGFPGYSTALDKSYDYDPAKAKQLLKDAGYADGFSFDIAAPAANNTNVMAQAIVQEWAKIGVTAHLTSYPDMGQLTTDVLAGKYPVTAFIYGALPTFIQSASFFTGGKTQYNPFDTNDSTIDGDLAKASSSSGADADRLYNQAWLYAQQQGFFANVYTRQAIFIYDKTKLAGFQLDSADPIPDIWDLLPAS
jgi:peptide/nickel transport system substrate-binding protein